MPTLDLQHLYNKAWLFASHAHVGQTMTSSDLPYTTHVAMVANELIFAHREEPVGAFEIALPAALLHDVVEDTDVTTAQLAEAFGAEVASTVACLSKNLIVPFSEARYFFRGLPNTLAKRRRSNCATGSPICSQRLPNGHTPSECPTWSSLSKS